MGKKRLFPRVGRAAFARIGIGRGIVYSPARRPTDATKRSLSAVLVCLVLVFGLSSPRVAGARSNVAPASPFLITFDGVNYHADSQSTASSYTGTLKFVMESAVTELNSGGGGIVNFAAGAFDFGSEFFKVFDLVNITFDGAGMNSTTIQNSSSDAADTEPFNFEGTDAVTISDLTVSAGGPLRTTSDAIDFDKGNNSTVERVKITASRGRGIVFDGKNAGWTSAGNTVRDCVIDGVADSGIEFLASTNNLVEGCTITNVARHGVEAGKSSPTAAQPNKKASDNVIRNNVIDNAGVDGIHINSSDRNQILGNQVTNSSNNVASADGIRISSSDSITCDENVVEGNVATDNQATKTQRYGLNISSALCNGTFVGGANNFIGNRLGPVNDLGTGTVYGPDTVAPTAPGNLTATGVYKTQIDLHWTASEDSVGVTGYEIWRDDSSLATIGAQTAYFDQTVTPGSTHSYQVRALDAAGNLSGFSNTATATTPTSGLLFHDGFETGDFSNWTQNNGLVIQQSQVFAGSYAAEGVSTGSADASAYKQLAPSETDLYYVIRFKVLSQAQNVNLLRFRNNLAGANAIATLFVTSTSPSRVGMRNDVTAVSTTSTTVAAAGTWHTAQVHLNVNGTSSQTEVWIDETMVPELSQSGIDLGTNPIGRLELGDPSLSRTFDVALDEVAYDRELIATTPGSSQTLTVSKDFFPDNTATVSVSLSCTSGSVDASPKPASEGSPAVFTITSFDSGATCSASEGAAPAGYTKNEAACQNVAIDAGPAGCTITNTQNSATFTVSKDFIPDNAATVSVSVTCTSGSVDASPKPASEGSPAVFTVTGFSAGATCSATEGAAPPGYAKNEAACQAVAIGAGPAACTITDTLNSQTFTVSKDFVPDSAAVVSVSVSCTSGSVDASPKPASEGSPAVFTVSGFSTGATCSATEGAAPAGYVESDNCQNVAIGAGPASCTITNTQSPGGTGGISFGSATTATNGNMTLTISKPSGTAQGDFLIAQISFRNGTDTAITGVPSGWTLVRRTDATTSIGQALYWKVAGASEGSSYTWTINQNRVASGGISRYTGVDNAAPFDPTAPTGSIGTGNSSGAVASNSPTATGLTTTTANTRVVAFFGFRNNPGATHTAPTGMTERYALTVGGGPSVWSDDVTQPAAGATGNKTSSTGGTTATWVAQLVALRAVHVPSATFTVSKDFVPNNAATVSVSLSCSSGSVGASPKPASEGSPAVFTVTGFSPGATCSATEGAAPVGYTKNEASCQSATVTDGGTPSCTITNTLNSQTFTVSKDFVPDSAASVSVSVSCTSGTVDASPKPASEGSPAVFTVTGFPAGATCSATEGAAPAGYTKNEASCQSVAIDSGPASCTITNTHTSVTLTVNKDFVPDDPGVVSVSLICTSGTPDASPKPASEGSPAVFTVSGFSAGATCSASESPVPAGYAESDNCQNVAIDAGPAGCTITNTPSSTTFTVNKNFIPDVPGVVMVSLTCTSGSVDASPKLASEASPAVFTITSFNQGATCTATENPAPPGFTKDETACQNVPITHGVSASCTIINNSAPTVVEVASFAARNTKLGVALTWRTRTERAVAGFNVWRVGNGRVVKLNRGLIRAKGAGGVSGASYRFVDRSAKANVRYTYRLQVVGFDGKRSWRASEKIRAAR